MQAVVHLPSAVDFQGQLLSASVRLMTSHIRPLSSLTFWHHHLKAGVIVAGSLRLEQRNSMVLLLRKSLHCTFWNQSAPNLWKPMAYVPGMAKDLWPRTVQIKEKEKAYRACQRNGQRLQLKMNESNDRNQESPKKGVSGKWRGKMCLFFKRKKKVFILHSALKLLTKVPVRKDYILLKQLWRGKQKS